MRRRARQAVQQKRQPGRGGQVVIDSQRVRRTVLVWAGLALWLVAVAIGCATPAERFDREAERFGLVREVVSGQDFRHVTYFKPGHPAAENSDLHVYLDGDGSPWVDGQTVAFDPTSKNALILRLIALDPAPSLLLGRPCYLGLARDRGCGPYLWTQGRYSPQVVASLAAALADQVRRRSPRELILIGFSGGGTLAMLVAARTPEVRGLVTLGANLDLDRWAESHGYSPLLGSLNPAALPPLDRTVRQMHVVGARDQCVDPGIVAAVATGQPNAELVVLDGCDHWSCWEAQWPAILRLLAR